MADDPGVAVLPVASPLTSASCGCFVRTTIDVIFRGLSGSGFRCRLASLGVYSFAFVRDRPGRVWPSANRADRLSVAPGPFGVEFSPPRSISPKLLSSPLSFGADSFVPAFVGSKSRRGPGQHWWSFRSCSKHLVDQIELATRLGHGGVGGIGRARRRRRTPIPARQQPHR